MFNDSRIYEDNSVNFELPFNRNLTVSWCIGTPLVFGLITLLIFWTDIKPEARIIAVDNTVPLTILNFGLGDGTGMSKGNLTAEGVAHRGAAPASTLHDAEVAAQTRRTTTVAETDPTVSSNLRSVSEVSSTDNNADRNVGNSARNVGIPDGSLDGSGLGSRGRGAGLGEGFGDVEWGGGGNRIVLSKRAPTFPRGVNTSGEIRIQFTVRPDGTVTRMILLTKADPALEKAALDALRQWRFNPIKDTVDMIGIIPFKFLIR